MNQSQIDIIDNLSNNGKLYVVPQRCLDDYYWMLSSVSNQSTSSSSSGKDMNITPNNDICRWSGGIRPILITNDQMRDHKLELLEPRLFRRWFSSHIVNYEFEPFLKDMSEERDITFVKADSFSREIQGNRNSNKSNDDDGSMTWHFPVEGWESNDRFCIRIPHHDNL